MMGVVGIAFFLKDGMVSTVLSRNPTCFWFQNGQGEIQKGCDLWEKGRERKGKRGGGGGGFFIEKVANNKKIKKTKIKS